MNAQKPTINLQQLQASNPDASVWVSASAGTGKTKILTDRVLRLLISGVKPEKILCITFTKAAAGEMNNRINKELSIWANLSLIKLEERLKQNFGNTPTKEQLFFASQLFHEKLSSIDTLKIQTIHSFCQSILSIFPLEAGISPGFQVIDEYKTYEVIKKIKLELFTQAFQSPANLELQICLEFLAEHLHEESISDLISEIVNQHNKFKNLINSHNNTEIDSSIVYKKNLKTLFNIANFTTISEITDELFCHLKHLDFIIDFDEDIHNEQAKDIHILRQFIDFKKSFKEEQLLKFEEFCNLFLTQTGSIRKTIFSKKFTTKYIEITEIFNDLKKYIFSIKNKLKSFELTVFSTNLFILAKYAINSYELNKQAGGYLDFNDLIYYTCKLLTDSEAKDWVLYKLDGFVQHVLVDEAQDTNFEQWQIIDSLVREFYSGSSSDETNRTFFIVGDEKQSIYSFQGADPSSFNVMNQYFKDKLALANKKYYTIDLSWSYRSLEAINIAVSKVFTRLRASDASFFTQQNFDIQCFRQGGGGRVEIWPLITNTAKEVIEPWPLPEQYIEYSSTRSILAKTVAVYVDNIIKSKKFLLSKNRHVNASDIIILVKQRDDFSSSVIAELHKLKINVAGIDRINLIENLAIQDLISLAKFVLLPQDDLNLACLLKSPIISLSESLLYDLAVERGRQTLWQNLNSICCNDINSRYVSTLNKLNQFITIYTTSSLIDFFSIILDSMGYREKLLNECGMEASELINEFIDLAMNFQYENGNNLQEFIIWIENADIDIKRDLEQHDSLRVMTVHGSKGLQAPIVILADTTRIGRIKPKMYWAADNLVLWPGAAINENEYYKSLDEKDRMEHYQEYLRLLYVAMTRAEDELIIFGGSLREEVVDNCWYNLIKDSMDGALSPSLIPENMKNFFPNSTEYLSMDLYKSSNTQVFTDQTNKLSQKNIPLIDTTPKYIPQENAIQELVSSPLKSRRATEYGTIIHKLLEVMFINKNLDFVLSHPLIYNLTNTQSKSLRAKLTNLFNLEQTQILFRYELKCEITIGLTNDSTSLGRLDLLAISQDQITIIDYKTDTNVPTSSNEVSRDYINQLKNYKELVSKLYPSKQIITKILWFENLSFMELENL